MVAEWLEKYDKQSESKSNNNSPFRDDKAFMNSTGSTTNDSKQDHYEDDFEEEYDYKSHK